MKKKEKNGPPTGTGAVLYDQGPPHVFFVGLFVVVAPKSQVGPEFFANRMGIKPTATLGKGGGGGRAIRHKSQEKKDRPRSVLLLPRKKKTTK